jgi:hypothetical protein
MVYVRKTKRMSKRRPRLVKRRRFNITKKKFGKTGFFKVMRWSSNDSTNNCHFMLIGNDALPAGDTATTFTLSNVNGSGELVSLFDNYRIVKVLYRWVITRNPDQAVTTTNKGVYPRLVWTHDFNDQIPIARSLMYQRANLKEFYFGDNAQKTRWYSLNPSSLVQMYESSTSTAYQPKWRQWLDTSDNTAPHYGIKMCYSDLYNNINIRLEAKIVIECKGIS